MKKKIAILGSTGSIGKTLINILKKDKTNFEIVLLSTNKNITELGKQAKFFNVKNLIVTDKNAYIKIKAKKNLKKNLIFNNFLTLDKLLKKKIDYVMSSISGIEGLYPTIKIIKHTRNIAIANKEAIICGWNILQKEFIKNKTNFIPVDSEHFSINYVIGNRSINDVENIYLTASGGPLKDLPYNQFKNIKVSDALKHPNWNMGKKISIDSATMMNKIFEIIEAHKIFNISYNKLKILVHPNSYVHAIIKYNDGMINIVAHDTTMKIPIHNSLYSEKLKFIKSDVINIKKLNYLDFSEINSKKFPVIKIISSLPKKNSLFETIIVAANDELVDLFLKKKIKFTDISSTLLQILSLHKFKKYKNIMPQNIESIEKLNQYVRFKINNLCI